ncbi:MAG: hypothetical protein HZA50_01595 [Planctomycetes bacterium]|nr:hypothetical protein [Planctomycetota bacterium]
MKQSYKRVPVCLGVLSVVLLLTACQGGQDEKKGYNCLFLGHSFFAPIAKELDQHPKQCGFPNHKQTIVFHGGFNGAPGMLWKSTDEDVEKAKKLLATGAVDLVAMTYHPAMGSEVADYQNWTDLALKHNPKTRFVIHAPWAMYKDQTLAQFEAESEKGLAKIHEIIDQLRKTYPKTSFLCIPQSRWMVGLWKLYEKKELPEVTAVKRADKQSTDCLFLDGLGHGGSIPVKMGALLWLTVIYEVDLTKYKFDTGTKADLKKLAQEIADGDPYARSGKPASQPKDK